LGVNGAAVTGLPLVAGNFAQIAALSPGIVSCVFNAGALDLGGIALPQINTSKRHGGVSRSGRTFTGESGQECFSLGNQNDIEIAAADNVLVPAAGDAANGKKD
jgi:hypothetical protein